MMMMMIIIIIIIIIIISNLLTHHPSLFTSHSSLHLPCLERVYITEILV